MTEQTHLREREELVPELAGTLELYSAIVAQDNNPSPERREVTDMASRIFIDDHGNVVAIEGTLDGQTGEREPRERVLDNGEIVTVTETIKGDISLLEHEQVTQQSSE